MSNFRPVDRETGFLLPPSVEEWLPERHLARFVVEVIEQLDLSAFVKAYRGSGSASYHPSMLLGLLVYGYATGVFSSRKLERATYDSVAFRFIAANDHPDHDTIAAFRRRFLDRIEGLFVEVLLLAREAGVLKLGTVALDGTKVHANASRHSALSWKHACELEARLKAEVAELMALAEAADGADVPDGMSVPEELARREDRLARIAEAKAVIEARARERLERERAEYEAKHMVGGARRGRVADRTAPRRPICRINRRARSRWGNRQGLDPVDRAMIVNERFHRLNGAVELRLGKICRGLAQDLIGLAELTVLTLQSLQAVPPPRSSSRPGDPGRARPAAPTCAVSPQCSRSSMRSKQSLTSECALMFHHHPNGRARIR